MAISNSNGFSCWWSRQISPVFTTKKIHVATFPCMAQQRGQETCPLCGSNLEERINACKWMGHGMKHCLAHRQDAKILLAGHDRGPETRLEERSHPVLSGKRVGAMCAMPFGLWLKGWVWAILCSSQGVFCNGKSSLTTATYSSKPVQYFQPIAATDIYCSKWKVEKGARFSQKYHTLHEGEKVLANNVYGDRCIPRAYATSHTSRVSS